MADPAAIDDAVRALALIERALVLLDAAGMTLAAAELDHVRHRVAEQIRTR